MAIAPTTPPPVSELPQAPDSSTMSPSTDPSFDTVANNFVSAQVSIVPQYNELGEWQEKTAQEVYDNAIEAENSAVNSAQSAAESEAYKDIAQQAGNLLGNWSELAGSALLGDVVLHIDGRWQATTAIADITASEPSLSNSDWVLINYNGKSLPIAGGVTLSAVAINEIPATQSNPLPLAASVPANTILRIKVDTTAGQIVTTNLTSGSDTSSYKNEIDSNGFIVTWEDGGIAQFTSNGVDNWRY